MMLGYHQPLQIILRQELNMRSSCAPKVQKQISLPIYIVVRHVNVEEAASVQRRWCRGFGFFELRCVVNSANFRNERVLIPGNSPEHPILRSELTSKSGQIA